jgi:hypothetical protein
MVKENIISQYGVGIEEKININHKIRIFGIN